jgi:hypothetical protein
MEPSSPNLEVAEEVQSGQQSQHEEDDGRASDHEDADESGGEFSGESDHETEYESKSEQESEYEYKERPKFDPGVMRNTEESTFTRFPDLQSKSVSRSGSRHVLLPATWISRLVQSVSPLARSRKLVLVRTTIVLDVLLRHFYMSVRSRDCRV